MATRHDETIRVLEKLLATLPEGGESEAAQILLDDAIAAQKEEDILQV